MRALAVAFALLAAAPALAETPDAVARRYGLAGELLVAKGDKVLLHRAYGPIAPAGGKRHRTGERWRLASITKQIVAAYVVESVGPAGLDVPIDPADHQLKVGQLTLRQLLTHHTGLANPDATPKAADGVPSFYKAFEPDIAYCTSVAARPGAPFAYNNCDYALIPVGLAVSAAAGRPVHRFPPNFLWAEDDDVGIPGYVGGKPEPSFRLASFGPAGGLLGTARAVFDFDRSLMTGRLLGSAALAELWKPEGNGSYQALGQWVFPGRLKGCAAPKRIVQRDGEIYGVQGRNFIFPDDDLVVIVFTNRSSDDFTLGEVWEGKGFVHDLLSAAACS